MWKADCAACRSPAPTGQARRTAQPRVEAVAPGRGVEPAVAGGEVVAARRSAPRPGRRSGTAGAGGHGRGGGARQVEPLAERERAAVRNEEPEPGMDEQADRRVPGLAAPPRPGGERLPGRPAERKQRRPRRPRRRARRSPAPTSGPAGRRPPSPVLGAGPEPIPEPRPVGPEQHQRAAARRRAVVAAGMEGAERASPSRRARAAIATRPGTLSRGSACRRRGR